MKAATPQVTSTLAVRRASDAGFLLMIWVILLLIVPANLVVGPLGAAGSPAQIVGLLALCWWLAFQLDKSQSSIAPAQPVRTAMLIFVAAVLASYVAAATRPIEAIELSAADRGLLIVLSWLGIVLLTSDGLTSRRRLDALLRLLVGAAAFAAVLGVAQFVTERSFVDQIQIPGLSPNTALTSVYDRNGFARAAGTSTHPIEFGVLLSMALPLALHYALADTSRSRLRRWLPIVAIGIAIPITLSRSTLLGLVVVLAVVLPTWPAVRRRWAYAWIGFGGLAVYVAVPGLLGTMGRLFTGIGEDNSAQSRVDSYEVALAYVMQNPIFGRGFSTFLPRNRILDNQYLGLLIETGVAGFVAFVALLVTGIVVATRTRRLSTLTEDRSLATALTATIGAAALACATFDSFGFPQVSGLLFVALGCITALSRFVGVGVGAHREPFVAASVPR